MYHPSEGAEVLPRAEEPEPEGVGRTEGGTASLAGQVSLRPKDGF